VDNFINKNSATSQKDEPARRKEMLPQTVNATYRWWTGRVKTPKPNSKYVNEPMV